MILKLFLHYFYKLGAYEPRTIYDTYVFFLVDK